MKYRIVEENCSYTPQYKRFFFWRNFEQDKYILDGMFVMSSTVVFSDLYGARKFLDGQIDNKNTKRPKQIIYPY